MVNKAGVISGGVGRPTSHDFPPMFLPFQAKTKDEKAETMAQADGDSLPWNPKKKIGSFFAQKTSKNWSRPKKRAQYIYIYSKSWQSKGTIVVNSPLLRPYFLGGWPWGALGLP